MDDDVDMDAPQISTLPEEKTPPPKPPRSAQARKSKPKQQQKSKAAEFPSWRKTAVTGGSDDEPVDDGEEEEDQLIDDEDDVADSKPMPGSAPAKTSETAPKKKTPAKRKPRKEPGTEEESHKKRTKKEKTSHTGPSMPGTPALTAPGLEATLSESLDDGGTGTNTGANTPSISVVDSEPPEPTPSSKTPKKKGTPRKTAPKTGKGKPSGLKMVIPALSAIVADDAASVMSEGGVSGTAASSPVTGNFEKSQPGSPDPEQPAPSSPTAATSAPLVEETNLENIPLPIYPLPSKPFPVQPPQKIPTGFAPPLPLDRSGKKVRHWRTAQREIRGIAGGRWFARSWVGDKESEYAAFAASKEGEKAANGLPVAGKGQASNSLSAPPLGKGSGKKGKGASSLNPSAAPSRDASVNPPEASAVASAATTASATPIPITSAVRAPTKMRIQQLPDDSQSDAAMDTDAVPVPPSGS